MAGCINNPYTDFNTCGVFIVVVRIKDAEGDWRVIDNPLGEAFPTGAGTGGELNLNPPNEIEVITGTGIMGMNTGS